MLIMIACGLILVAGLAMGGVWGGLEFQPPPSVAEPTAADVARRFAWYAALILTGGIIAGITVIGGGGRLAMRLLAVTGGDKAQGRITEAEEVVGRITTDGTISFILFNGIFGGVAAAVIYLLLRRYLPSGWLSGVAFGVGALVVAGTTIDPLRSENRDFDIVGPGWLSVLVFAVLVVAFGVVLAAVIARLSHWLPLPDKDRRTMLRYSFPTLLAIAAFMVTAVLLVVCLIAIVATRWRPIINAVRSHTWTLVGRALVVVGVAVSLPNAVSNLVDIVNR